MLTDLSLRSRISYIFMVMVIIVAVGGGSMFWYTNQIDTMVVSMVDKEFVLYKTAQDMELALANQKGFLTYYLVDGNGKWLKALGQYRQMFYQLLEEAQDLDLTAQQRHSLEIIAEKYSTYAKAKDKAIENYQTNKSQSDISSLHEKQREVFFGVLDLCQAFSEDQWQVILQKQGMSAHLSQDLRVIAFIFITLFMILSSFFLFILYRHILGPIRGLALETGSTAKESSKNEISSLTQSLKGMMRDFDETNDELIKSRRNLLQAERMAMVGELAAGVAHTIRNPFTSIKMRMFSLGRTLQLSDTQSEDLQVISDEIARIDKIVENFLEFARPPKLQLKECCLGDIVKSVLTLLEYRLKAYNVEPQYNSQPNLPRVRVDADRIKEALVNLVVNSCEAMENGGTIIITEQHQHHPQLGSVVSLEVTDNGPGIPKPIIDKVVTPFFTTKEDGSGLGLSIVNRIAREHNGKFIVTSNPAEGTRCNILLPTEGGEHEPYPDN